MPLDVDVGTRRHWILREATIAYRGERRPPPRDGFARRIETSADVVAVFGAALRSELVEVFHVVALSTKNRVIGWSEIGRGGISACPVSPADVFRFLILANASACIYMHNHPSGEPHPSADDVALTKRLVDAGRIIGVRCLDHVIIAEGGYFSLADAGMLAGSARLKPSGVRQGEPAERRKAALEWRSSLCK